MSASAARRRCGSRPTSRTPARGADSRRRQHRPFATNNRSPPTNDRRRPPRGGRPLPLQSAAQAAGAARAPRRSISHAHRSPQARAGQSERCHKPPQRSCLNRGAVAHHPLARAASAAPSRARARGFGAIEVNARPFTADFSAPCFGEHPVAEPRGAAGGRSSKYHQHRCRRVAASVVLVAHAAARMSPCGGECRVGRTLPRGGPLVARRTPAPARRRFAAPPASPVRHQQPFATNKRSTSAAARRPPAAVQSAAQAAGAARAPRRSISHAHRSPQARAGQSERCHKPPQRSCLNRGAVAHHPLARAASAAPSRARARGFGAIEVNAPPLLLIFQHHALASTP